MPGSRAVLGTRPPGTFGVGTVARPRLRSLRLTARTSPRWLQVATMSSRPHGGRAAGDNPLGLKGVADQRPK